MRPEDYNWETWFEAAENLMCHKFSERVEARTNIKTGQIQLFKDGNEVNRIDGSEMTMIQYEQLLVRTANEAATLHNITNN